MAEVETVTRIEKVQTRRGSTVWRLKTVGGGVYFADRPELLKDVRPGLAVELEAEERWGFRFIKSLRPSGPDGDPGADGGPGRLQAELPLAPGRPEPAQPDPAEEAGRALKVLALDGALRVLSARGRPFGVDELLETAERILAWLR